MKFYMVQFLRYKEDGRIKAGTETSVATANNAQEAVDKTVEFYQSDCKIRVTSVFEQVSVSEWFTPNA